MDRLLTLRHGESSRKNDHEGRHTMDVLDFPDAAGWESWVAEAAKADGRWESTYESQRTADARPDLVAALAADPGAGVLPTNASAVP
jgi:hypothetical protein